MLEHSVHVVDEEGGDVDLDERNPHVLQSATCRMRHWLVLQSGFERLLMAPIVFERKYGHPAESVLLPTLLTSLLHVRTLYDSYLPRMVRTLAGRWRVY